MGKSVVQMSTVAQGTVPTPGTSDKVATIGNTAKTLEAAIGEAFSAQATEVRVSVRGTGDLCVRFDGGTPVGGSVGEVWFPGAVMAFNLETARKMKVVRDGSADCIINVVQFSR